MYLQDLNPFIRYAKNFPRHNLSKNVWLCYDCRLFYVYKGNGTITANDKKIEVTPETAVFLPAGTKYSFDVENGIWSLYIFEFDLDISHSDIKDSLSTPLYINHEKSKIVTYDAPSELSEPCSFPNVSLYMYLNRIVNLYFDKPNCYREISSGILKTVLSELAGQIETNKNSALIHAVRDYIRKNYQSSVLSNAQIAKALGYHPYYLANIVKQLTGEALHIHILNHRLAVAEDLLLSTDIYVSQISWKCGFTTPSHFGKHFKEKYGYTPNQYRKLFANV